jgi:manganese transport protein
LGTAIGLQLLFGIPMIYGVIITVLDTLLFLVIQYFGQRLIELIILFLMIVISTCFVIEMFHAKPSFTGILLGFVPSLPPGSLVVATGILGATIMPHNLYLHSVKKFLILRD